MERRKLTKEDIDKVRNIEGFPVGKDEDIISLSDAPYYTACPNPFIEDFIKENGTPYDETTDDYHREPFAADVSEGKTDNIYTAHTYHTKVPYKAIMKYILHYTNPGDIVFDGFGGSGMTGIAAQMCGKPADEFDAVKNAKYGERKAIISDLSPAAQFISYGYNRKVDASKLIEEADNIIHDCDKKIGWMYQTKHNTSEFNLFSGTDNFGRINYVVWSDVFLCPHCGEEFTFYNAALDDKNGKVKDEFLCPHCRAKLKKKDCTRSKEAFEDDKSREIKYHAKLVPVLINYIYNGKKYTKEPDDYDFELIEKIRSIQIPFWYPTDKLPEGSNTQQPISSHNYVKVDDFYTKRNLYALSCLFELVKDSPLRIAFQSMNPTLTSKLVRYNMGNRGNGPLNGTLYVASLTAEADVLKSFRGKVDDFIKVYNQTHFFNGVYLNTSSSTDLRNIPSNSIDYIFTDPPFGANINYSELSFIWESWLKVKTNSMPEAIMNDTQKKGIVEYQQLMTRCFAEFYRILKPNRWITVEFHNSKNAVWNAIQEALLSSGFIIADVRTLDKKQGSFKQVTTSTAVQQDLIISAYKPKQSFTKKFKLHSGTEQTVWEFVSQHLGNLPVTVKKGGKLEVIAERQAYLLFDRMVAYHIMNGLPVPIDATEFYTQLDNRYLKRDNMYFLPDQVNDYDTARITLEVEDIQLTLFVNNEKTAIAWLYQQLDINGDGPQTYSELQPKFMKEAKSVEKYEMIPELQILLEENFLKDEAGKWYVPDRTKEADVAKLREKNLWKEFEGYMNSKGKLKLFRSEAIRVGFARLWKDKNYQAIVEIAERLPEQIVQEDPNILMYYDISLSRI